MILNDEQIKVLAKDGMIRPFEPRLIKRLERDGPFGLTTQRLISYGLSSFGYDIRLSPLDFRIFQHVPGTVVDPKRINDKNLVKAPLYGNIDGSVEEIDPGYASELESFFILPANTYGLGVAVEYLKVPRDVTVLCVGKSSYARVGLIANLTPAESEWRGHLTLEFSNSSSADVKIYANEGVVQLLFLKGEPCEISYADRNGKYQDQDQEVTLPRV